MRDPKKMMINYALAEIRGDNTRIARSHTSSLSALKKILTEHVGG